MNIERNLENNILTLTLIGRLDTMTAPLFEKEIVDLDNVNLLIIDMKNLEYISSAGLRVILKAKKAMNSHGDMKLINVCKVVMEVLEITGFSNIITIE